MFLVICFENWKCIIESIWQVREAVGRVDLGKNRPIFIAILIDLLSLMISAIRKIIAKTVGVVLIVFTLGIVKINWTGSYENLDIEGDNSPHITDTNHPE